MTSNANALRHSPAKTVDGKRAPKGAMPPTVSVSFRPAPRARKSANAFVPMDGPAPTACQRDAPRGATTASVSKENANATAVSWAMRAIWPDAPITATTMASATPPAALPCANVNRVTMVKPVARKTAPTSAPVTACARGLEGSLTTPRGGFGTLVRMQWDAIWESSGERARHSVPDSTFSVPGSKF